MSGLTESLARFVTEASRLPIPPEALKVVRTGFVDTIATMLAGMHEPVTGVVRRHVAAQGNGRKEARLLFGDERVSARDAALVNGTSAHALDYDDVGIGGHPSTVLVPAALAEAEAVGASGAEAMRAYLVGYEVWAELYAREQDQHHLKGWHPTAVFGVVGAAAVSAYLRKLPLEQTRNALAIAGSMAAGLVANFGTPTKPFHAGRAAANGLEAVQLAQAGLVASPDAFEHHAGYLMALSPAGRVDRQRPADTLGKKLRILENGLSIKRYPMCYSTHRVIDGVVALAEKANVQPADVERVDATVGVAQASMLRNHAPVTVLEAKFSLEFAVAAAIHERACGLAQLDEKLINRPDVRDTMKKLNIETVDTKCPIEPAFALNDRVVIRLKDGRTLDSGEIRFPRGNAQLPMRDDELRAKFMDCTRDVKHLDAGALFDGLMRLETLAKAAELGASGASRSAA
jgi:2-methylcitrate dehydratase PrpD